MVAEVQRAKVERQLGGAVAAGARVLRGPRRAPARLVPGPDGGGGRGRHHGPAHHRDLRAGRPVQRVGSLDEAIARANALPYGLGANVYTGRMDYVLRCMEELEVGTVWFNDPLTDNDAGPFGGMKMSGNARELGPEGLEAFRETKHVHLRRRANRNQRIHGRCLDGAGPGPGSPSCVRPAGRRAAALLILTVLVKGFLIQAFFIPSRSMEPTLDVGDRVVVNRLAYRLGDPAPGQVVVFLRPTGADQPRRRPHLLGPAVAQGLGGTPPGSEDLIKRVVGVPDELEGRDGHLIRNGQEVDEPYLRPAPSPRTSRRCVIKPDHLWVMGDNREDSADRSFGQVRSALVGRAADHLAGAARAACRAGRFLLWGQRSKITCARRREGDGWMVLAAQRNEVTERGRRRGSRLLTGAALLVVYWAAWLLDRCWPPTPGPPTTSSRRRSPWPTPGWPSAWSRAPGPWPGAAPRRCCGCWPPAGPAASCSPWTCSTTFSTGSGSPASGAGRAAAQPGPRRRDGRAVRLGLAPAGRAAGRRLRDAAVDPWRPRTGRSPGATTRPTGTSSSPFFPDEAACLRYLEGPAGRTGSSARPAGRTGRRGAGRASGSSAATAGTVTAGTLFQGTRTPLRQWFAAAWLVATAEQGVSARQLARALDLGSYETAWTMLHRFRRAGPLRPPKLVGRVEVGTVAARGRPDPAGGSFPSTAAIALEDRGEGGPQRLPSGAGDELVALGRVVEPGTLVRAVRLETWWPLAELGFMTERALSLTHLPASSGPGRVAARHPPRRHLAHPARLVPGRVHLPLQPPQLDPPWPALLPPLEEAVVTPPQPYRRVGHPRPYPCCLRASGSYPLGST